MCVCVCSRERKRNRGYAIDHIFQTYALIFIYTFRRVFFMIYNLRFCPKFTFIITCTLTNIFINK